MHFWSGSLAFHKLSAAALKPDLSLHGYPEYKTRLQDLDVKQRLAFERFAQQVYASLSTRMPVRAVLIVGNADNAWHKPLAQRHAFEMQVSVSRAQSAEKLLLDRIALLAGHPQGRHLVKTRTVGLGATHLAVKNASTEAQMRQNRRVEFVLLKECVRQPSCHAA